MTAERVVAEVAAAVGLDEGEAGVLDVLRVVARFEPVAVRTISRVTDLPIPIAAAVCNELRSHDVIGRRRPVRLTPLARRLFPDIGGPVEADSICTACDGRGSVVPTVLAGVERELHVIADACPAPRLEIDQTHCTVPTKIRRVLAMDESGALAGKRVLLLGDDDAISVAIKLVLQQLARAHTIRSVLVIDVDPAVVAFLREQLADTPFRTEVVAHDLREPLPVRLRASADTVFTDPPYTAAGARLFLSRALEALAPGPGRRIFLAFGGRRPNDVLCVQRAIGDAGMTVRRLVRNFNEYRGAGALAGTSHLYELVTTSSERPGIAGRYEGALYTGEQ